MRRMALNSCLLTPNSTLSELCSGGITHDGCQWGLSSFFNRHDTQFHHPIGQQPQRPARLTWRRFTATDRQHPRVPRPVQLGGAGRPGVGTEVLEEPDIFCSIIIIDD